jgi:hypothetical protein
MENKRATKMMEIFQRRTKGLKKDLLFPLMTRDSMPGGFIQIVGANGISVGSISVDDDCGGAMPIGPVTFMLAGLIVELLNTCAGQEGETG